MTAASSRPVDPSEGCPTSVARGRTLAIPCVLLLLVAACVPSSGPEGPEDASADAPADAPAAWVDLVGQRIAASGYVLTERDGGLHARNAAQDLRAQWQGGALRVRPAVAALGSPNRGSVEGWELRVRTSAWGRADSLKALPPAAARLGSCRPDGALTVRGECLRRVELPQPGITEWWENREDGLEQGWTIAEPPRGRGPLRVEVAVEGMEVSLNARGDEARLAAQGGSLRYAGLAAWDATGRALEAFMERTDQGLALVVDDRDAAWPITVDPILSSAAVWSIEGGSYAEQMGWAVASAGDVNGDGFDDVVIGAPVATDGEMEEGLALVFHGSVAGLSPTASWVGQQDQPNARFGEAASSAGDVNGDGYSDLVVGAPNWADTLTYEGAAFLYLGSASGLPTTASWSVVGGQGLAYLGRSVAAAGDVNADGYSDVLIGADSWDGALVDQGQVQLFIGSGGGLASLPTWTAEGEQIQAYFGRSVAGAGDVNGDGYDDVAVGAFGASNPEPSEGRK